MALVGECRGWDQETVMLSHWQEHRDLFPYIPFTEQFHIETNHAHTSWGLFARLHTKLAAHTLCIYINRLLGKPNFLQIKGLAFPI